MFNYLYLVGVTLLASLPGIVSAGASGLASGEGDTNQLAAFIGTVVGFINQILIPAILALAFLVFVYGVFKYFVAGGADDEAKEKGKSLMLYAIGGFVLILIFFGVVNLLATSIGLQGDGIGTTPGINIIGN